MPCCRLFFTVLLLCFPFTQIYAQKQSGKVANTTTVKPKRASENLSGTDITYYYLKLWVDISNKSINGSNDIHFTALKPTDSFIIDIFPQYIISGVLHDGKWLREKRSGKKLTVYFPETIQKDVNTRVQVHYEGKPQVAKKAPWDGGFVWAKDSLDRDWVGVACEQLGASSWWPCKDDLADEPDSVRMTMHVPKGMFCVSNGQLRPIYAPEDNRFTAFDWHVTYPINIYNITLNIGYYERIRDSYDSQTLDADGKPVTYAVDYFFLDYHAERAKAFFADDTYARTKTMLQSFESYFGTYPFPNDGYALVETPYWGMEHQGAIAYGNNFKLNAHDFDFILVHESGHEWWGNAVSCNDAADMWIHESFTTYSEALYVESLYGYAHSVDYLKMQYPNIANKKPIQGPRGVNFHAREDNDIYYKGSWVLHTLRSVVNNDSLWFAALHGIQKEFRYKTVTTEDVTAYLEKSLGKDLKAFFSQYLYESYLPQFTYRVIEKKGKLVLQYKWERAVDEFDLPVDIYINDKKTRLFPTNKYKTLKLDKGVEINDININADRFLIEIIK